MNPGPTHGHGADLSTVSLCLLPGFDCSALVDLLNTFYLQGQYAVSLDLCKAPHLGPVEIRTLGRFAESCKRRGGFLRLENASRTLAMIIQVFRFDDWLDLAPEPEAAPSLWPSWSRGDQNKWEAARAGAGIFGAN